MIHRRFGYFVVVHAIIGGISHLHIFSLFSDFNCSPCCKVKFPNWQIAPFVVSFDIDSGSMVSFLFAVQKNKNPLASYMK